MAQGSGGNLAILYTELSRSGQSGEYDRALKLANKILQEDPEDAKAYHCKVVCHIQLSEFQEALDAINRNTQLTENLEFEKAYCLYRLNKINDAWAILRHLPKSSFKVKELLAQVLYRLEKYDECFEAFKDLIKNSEDEYEDERETNLSAVIASMCAETGKEVKNAPQLREHTYEMCYNCACILLSQGKFVAGKLKLQAAEELCKKSLEEEEVPEDEIEQELGVIRTQMGYALQMQNKTEQALKLFNQVLKQRPTDTALIAVASNNIVTIHKDQNVFDSKKKMKAATVEGLESKLTLGQRQAIALNHCLLLYHTNQYEQCKTLLQAMEKTFPQASAEVTLLKAALLCREKLVSQAVDLLEDFASSHPEKSLTISFTLCQLLLSQGHISQACAILRSLGDISHKPGVVSALVTLYLNLEDRESASAVLTDAISWHRKHNPNSTELTMLVQESGRFHLQHGMLERAASMLEELRRSNPNDPKMLAQLISAYSQFDPEKSREISKDLPPIGDLSNSMDVDALETATWMMGAKYVKKGTKADPSPAPQTDVVVKKKKKKRKGKLPKNYDPNVDPDPERWLPKRERSTYKKRKDRRGGVGKGTQGAVASSNDMDATRAPNPSPRPGVAASSPATGTQASPNPQGPRQQRPQPLQKKKKKKGGRW